MITAAEARKMTNEILEPIYGSVEFLTIMSSIEREIKTAVSNGLESIEIISYTLPVMNNYKFPKCVNADKINKDHFWWHYVKDVLVKNGFKISNTTVFDHYIVSW